MAKYKIITNVDNIYVVEAETEEAAIDIALSGDVEPVDSEYQGYDSCGEIHQ